MIEATGAAVNPPTPCPLSHWKIARRLLQLHDVMTNRDFEFEPLKHRSKVRGACNGLFTFVSFEERSHGCR